MWYVRTYGMYVKKLLMKGRELWEHESMGVAKLSLLENMETLESRCDLG